MNATKTIEFSDGTTLNIFQDCDPESPRSWDNNGIMVCFHSRYILGDEHNHKTPQDFREWMDEQGNDIIACLPLYLYDHSGLTISTGPFTCPWDSGQVGWIIATRESLESGGHNVDELDVEQVKKWLQGEVDTYDQYLRGDIHGFTLNAPPVQCSDCGHVEKGEELDSCWGFYGDDPVENGMADHLEEEYREELRN